MIWIRIILGFNVNNHFIVDFFKREGRGGGKRSKEVGGELVVI